MGLFVQQLVRTVMGTGRFSWIGPVGVLTSMENLGPPHLLTWKRGVHSWKLGLVELRSPSPVLHRFSGVLVGTSSLSLKSFAELAAMAPGGKTSLLFAGEVTASASPPLV